MWPMLKPILFWRGETATQLKGSDKTPSTTPGADPPRDAKDSGSARSHSTHLETISSDRPKNGHLHGASDGTKLYFRYGHAPDVTYAKFHARNARTAVPK